MFPSTLSHVAATQLPSIKAPKYCFFPHVSIAIASNFVQNLFAQKKTQNTQKAVTVQATYCFDALMKDRFVDKIKFAKLSNEFDVAQHFDLRNGPLLFLFI